MDINVTIKLESSLQYLLSGALAALAPPPPPAAVPAPEAAPAVTTRSRRKTAGAQPLPEATNASTENAPAPEAALPETASAPAPEAAGALTLEHVRGVAYEKSRIDKLAVKQALTDLGSENLSALPAEKYADFIKKIEKL